LHFLGAMATCAFSGCDKMETILEELDISPGDACKAAVLLTIRSGESVATEIIGLLPPASVLQVLEMGQEPTLKTGRVKVAAGDLVGWISMKTSSGKPMILAEDLAAPNDPVIAMAEKLVADHFEEGGTYQLKSMVTIRAGEALSTPVMKMLPPGGLVLIIEISPSSNRRARISSGNVEGWISLVNKSGDLMLVSAEVCQESGDSVNGEDSDRDEFVVKGLLAECRELVKDIAIGGG